MSGDRAVERVKAGACKRVIACSLRALLLFTFVMMAQISMAQQNKSPYDLNDPRNPDCPCHKYQKLADEEYAKQNEKENERLRAEESNKNLDNVLVQNIENDNNNGVELQSKTQIQRNRQNADPVSSGNSFSTGRNNKKKASTWFKKKYYRTKLKHSRIKKARPNYAVCYKW